MNATVTEREGYTLAELEGTIDESAIATFDEHLHSAIETRGTRMLVDLSGSERITSAGVGHLVTLVSRANSKGSRVVLVNPTPFVASILKVTKLDKFFDIEPNIDAGIARLQAPN